MFGKPLLLHDSRLADAGFIDTDTMDGYDVKNLLDFRPYTWWRPRYMPQNIFIDSNGSADYWLVYGHDLFTQGATIELRGSNDLFITEDVLIDSITPTDDEPFLRTFNTVTYNFWRIRLTGSGFPAIAIIAFGNKLEFPRRLINGFDPVGKKSQGQINRSVKGHPLGTVIDYELWKQPIKLRNIDINWLRNNWLPAYDSHLKSVPSVFAWDPVEHASELYLVNPVSEFDSPHIGGQFCTLSFDLEGVA